MIPALSLVTLLTTALWSLSPASAIDVEGAIKWNKECPDIKALHPQSKVLLDGGIYSSGIQKDGRFKLRDVAPGSYLLEVLARDHVFEPLRVDVIPPDAAQSTPEQLFAPEPDANIPSLTKMYLNAIQIRPAPPATPFEPWSSLIARATAPPPPPPPSAEGSVPQQQQQLRPRGVLPLLPYPIEIKAKVKKVYVVPNGGFDLYGMLIGNPMMLLMVGVAAMMFVMPKILENIDPELLNEMRQTQGQMQKSMNKFQDGDLKAILEDPTANVLKARADAPAGSSAGTPKAPVAAGQSSAGVRKTAAGGGKKKR